MPAFDASSDTLQLRRVRLHGVQDGLRARLRFEAALAGFDGASLSLPCRSLLIVNHLAPTARLRLGRSGAAQGFDHAVRSALERTARNAQRPWINPAMANAEAVLFSDEAELIACLLRDWLQGSNSSRWWWPVVLEGLPMSEWWRLNLLPRGDVLPAVLAHLAAQRQAVVWLKYLSESEVIQAVEAIIAAHAMTSLSTWLSTASPISKVAQTSLTQQTDTCIPALPNNSLQNGQLAYRSLIVAIPEVQAPALTIPQRRLLALALGLQRTSAWTRSLAFVAALQVMEADYAKVDEDSGSANISAESATFGGAGVTESPNNPDTSDSMIQEAKICGSGLNDQSKAVSCSFEQLNKSSPAREDGVIGNQNKDKNLFLSLHLNSLVDVESVSILKPSVLPVVSLPNDEEVFNPLFQDDMQPDTSVGDSVLSPEFTPHLNNKPLNRFQQAIETQYGGVFYLLNVALALGFYGDFTQPRAVGIALSPWDWLALIGRAWFGRNFEQDALWWLLAELAGRSANDFPGVNFLPPDAWIVPDEWLKPWGEPKRITVYVTRDRLQICHDAGFVLIDAARIAGMAPLVQARQLCGPSEVLSAAQLVRIYKLPQQLVQPITGNPGLSRWLSWVLLYLLSRLQRALGCDTPAFLTRLLCCHTAQLTCTAMAIDVHLSLAALPIEVRIAGLDRDPGWIPAAGRSIVFHFA